MGKNDDLMSDDNLEGDLEKHSSENDCDSEIGDSSSEDYNVANEGDKGDPNEVEYDAFVEKMVEFENLAENAPPLDNNLEQEIVPGETPNDQPKKTSTTGEASKTKKKGRRGPSKGLKNKGPMYLEFDNCDQPCGEHRKDYGKHVGFSIRKVAITYEEWTDVPQVLKDLMWDDTVVCKAFEFDNI